MQQFGDFFINNFLFSHYFAVLKFLHDRLCFVLFFLSEDPYCRVEIGEPSSEGTSCVGVDDF